MTDEQIRQQLTDKEYSRFRQIQWRRTGDNKLYFGAFETKLEAFRFLQKAVRRYAYGGRDSNKLYELCEEYQEQGINLYTNHFSRWLREIFDIEIKWSRSDRPKKKKQFSVSIDKDLFPYYEALKDQMSSWTRSEYMNHWYRHIAGLDINSLIVYFYNEGDKERPVPVTFFWYDEECLAVYMGSLGSDTKKLIESLTMDAEQHGLDYVKTKCRGLGLFTFGLTSEE